MEQVRLKHDGKQQVDQKGESFLSNSDLIVSFKKGGKLRSIQVADSSIMSSVFFLKKTTCKTQETKGCVTIRAFSFYFFLFFFFFYWVFVFLN